MSGYNLKIRSRTVTQEKVTFSVFQNILKERIAERRNIAKEKCEVGRRSIQGMWSKNGVDPAEVFPPEMWKIILNELGPDEKMNMFNIHDMFRKLLEHTKIRDILLPKLIASGVMDFHTVQLVPLVFRYGCDIISPPVEFTTLRSVSKSVRDAVDTYYENILLKFLRFEVIPDFFPFVNINLILGFSGGIETNSILKSFMERAASPDTSEKLDFCIRSLEISIMCVENVSGNENLEKVKGFVNEVTCFLKQTGHNFWRFQLFCGDLEDLRDARVLVKLYKALRMWLELMPELKWLNIKFSTSAETLLPRVRPQVAELSGTCAPELKKLERFDLNLMTSRPDVLGFCKAILQRNMHIKMFRFPCHSEETVDPVFEKFLPLVPELLPNLDCLDLSNETIDLDNLRKCLNFDWQLKKLFLCLGSKYDCINGVFRLLEKFPTLEQVTLLLTNLIVSPNGNITFLRLPNLKVFDGNLSIEKPMPICSKRNFQIFLNLHFLLYCSNLKTIKWKSAIRSKTIREMIAKYLESSPKGMIDFSDGRKDLSGSNIWNVFPRLEEVSVKHRDSTRPPALERIYHNRQLVKSWAGKSGRYLRNS